LGSAACKAGNTNGWEWMVGYGIGCGAFGAYRSKTSARIKLLADGTVTIQSATSDIGPGTATSMTLIASDTLGIAADKITFELGDSSFPVAPTQGGSQTCSSVGSAVHDVCIALRQKLNGLEGLPADSMNDIEYSNILTKHSLPFLELTQSSEASEDAKKYSMYSFSAHFAQVYVHPLTGVVKVKKLVAVVDGGKIVNHKTASSQMIGGAVGGIGMVLTEEAVFDDRFGAM
jgi:xanthine dehydrogenase YagR molybdenum-binding subunit